MAKNQSKDVGLNFNVRPGSVDLMGTQPDLFPFDAWSFDDPNRTPAPKVRLKSPWAIVVGASDIDGDIDGSQIADGTVDTQQLAPDAVDASILAPNSVNTDNIVEDAVTNTQLADNSVSSSTILENAVGTLQIANDAITNAQLAIDAVQNANIATNAVTTDSLAPNSVTGAEIASSSITTPKLDQGNITIQSSNYVAGTSGWAIDQTGTAEFQDGIFRGTLASADGVFTGSLSAVDGTFVGTLTAVDGTFTGTLTAADGTFEGRLTAAEGSLGAFESIALTDPSVFSAGITQNTVYDILFLDVGTPTAVLPCQGTYGAVPIRYLTYSSSGTGQYRLWDDTFSLVIVIANGSSSTLGSTLSIRVFDESVVRGTMSSLEVSTGAIDSTSIDTGAVTCTTIKGTDISATKITLDEGYFLTKRGTGGIDSGQIATENDFYDAALLITGSTDASVKVEVSCEYSLGEFNTGVLWVSGTTAYFSRNLGTLTFDDGDATAVSTRWIWV